MALFLFIIIIYKDYMLSSWPFQFNTVHQHNSQLHYNIWGLKLDMLQSKITSVSFFSHAISDDPHQYSDVFGILEWDMP